MVSVALVLALAPLCVSALRLPQTRHSHHPHHHHHHHHDWKVSRYEDNDQHQKKVQIADIEPSNFMEQAADTQSIQEWWPFAEFGKADTSKPADATCLPRLEFKKNRQLNYYNEKDSFPQNCGEHPDLCTVLRETANDKHQVIVGVLMGHMSTLPHFVQSLKRSGNDKHFMLAVLDDKAKQWAIDNGVKYWHKPMQIPKSQDDGRITNHAVSSLKFGLFQDLIKAGAKVLVSDLDVAYLSGDVFKYIYDDSDIEGMSDGWDSRRAYGYDDVNDSPEMGWSRYHHSTRIFHFNSGLFYMNPTQESFSLMSTLADRVSKESIWDQAAFNNEIMHPSSPDHKASDVMTRVMDIECFSNSRVLFTTLRDRKPDFRPVLTHMNAHPEKYSRMEDTIKHYYDGDDRSWQKWSKGSGLRGSAEEKTNSAMGDALHNHFGQTPQKVAEARAEALGVKVDFHATPTSRPSNFNLHAKEKEEPLEGASGAKVTGKAKLPYDKKLIDFWRTKHEVHPKKVTGFGRVKNTSVNYDVQIINHFDSGYSDVFTSWKKCAIKAMGPKAFKNRVHTIDTTPVQSSFIQVDANPSPQLKRMLFEQFLDFLKQGKKTIHVEVDAFLQRDPNVLFEMYPQADVIGSIDVAGRKNSWYLGPRDKVLGGARGRHGGDDPFYPLGFMINIGVAGMRPNEKTISLVEEMLQPDVMKDVEEQWCGEQVLFSEKLFFRPNCTWKLFDGTEIPMLKRESEMSEEEYQADPEPPMWRKFGQGEEVFGECPTPKGNLKVVALPWKLTGRDDRPFQNRMTVTHHPSGSRLDKIKAGERICQPDLEKEREAAARAQPQPSDQEAAEAATSL